MVAGFGQGHACSLCPAPAPAFGADVASTVFGGVEKARGKCGGLHVDLIKRLFSFHIFFLLYGKDLFSIFGGRFGILGKGGAAAESPAASLF
jgi:hypothetical protein